MMARRSFILALFIFSALTAASGQTPSDVSEKAKIVDKTVAVINDGVRVELITYSDILWQLALQPGAPLDQPDSQKLNQVLTTLIDQRIFALEAERMPQATPPKAEIDAKIKETLARFPSTADFEARLRQVGINSISDDAFERLIAQRVSIDRYIDFRFRSFVVITAEEEDKYYNDVYLPEFRRRNPSRIIPPLSEVKDIIREQLTEDKVATRLESYLDEAKRRVEVVILSEV